MQSAFCHLQYYALGEQKHRMSWHTHIPVVNLRSRRRRVAWHERYRGGSAPLKLSLWTTLTVHYYVRQRLPLEAKPLPCFYDRRYTVLVHAKDAAERAHQRREGMFRFHIFLKKAHKLICDLRSSYLINHHGSLSTSISLGAYLTLR